MDDKTLFEKIVDRQIPASIIYEDDKHLAFLDLFPLEKGHTLVISKKAYKDMNDMPEDEYLELQKVVYRLSKHIMEVMGAKGMNVWSNSGKIAGQLVPHVHFHICPRSDPTKRFECEDRESYLKNEMDNIKKKLEIKKL